MNTLYFLLTESKCYRIRMGKWVICWHMKWKEVVLLFFQKYFPNTCIIKFYFLTLSFLIKISLRRMTLFFFNLPFWGVTYIQHNLLILNMQYDEFGQMWTVTKSLPESLYRKPHHPRGSHMALCSQFQPPLQMLATTNPLSVGIIPAYSRIFTWLLLSVVFVIHHSDCWVVFPRMDIP